MTYTIAAVKTVEQYLFDRKRPYQGVFFSTAGDLRPPRGLLGSRLKLSSDPIIQLAEVVARLEGDDGWNTCGGCAWCGAHRSYRPDRPALLQLTLNSRHRRNSVVTFQLNASRQKARLRCKPELQLTSFSCCRFFFHNYFTMLKNVHQLFQKAQCDIHNPETFSLETRRNKIFTFKKAESDHFDCFDDVPHIKIADNQFDCSRKVHNCLLMRAT